MNGSFLSEQWLVACRKYYPSLSLFILATHKAVPVFSGPPKALLLWGIRSQLSAVDTWSEYFPVFAEWGVANIDSIWLWFRTGGPILGGAIVLGKNKCVIFKMKYRCDWVLTDIVLRMQRARERSIRVCESYLLFVIQKLTIYRDISHIRRITMSFGASSSLPVTPWESSTQWWKQGQDCHSEFMACRDARAFQVIDAEGGSSTITGILGRILQSIQFKYAFDLLIRPFL